jgi:hypothetical protein
MSYYVSSLRIPYYSANTDSGELICKSKLKAHSLSSDVKTYYMTYSIYNDRMHFVGFKKPEDDFTK